MINVYYLSKLTVNSYIDLNAFNNIPLQKQMLLARKINILIFLS